MDTGAEALPGQPWEGALPFKSSFWVPPCLLSCPCAPLGFNGLMAPGMGLAVAGKGIIWPPLLHCLSEPLCGCVDELLSDNSTHSVCLVTTATKNSVGLKKRAQLQENKRDSPS